MSSGCIFCEIIARTLPAQIVFEDKVSLAFLDKTPLFHGHCLLVPKRHCETLLGLLPTDVGPFFQASQRLIFAVQTAMQSQGTFVAINNIVSQSVPHLHAHIVPRTKGDGLKGFFWPRQKYQDDEQMASVAARIRLAIGN